MDIDEIKKDDTSIKSETSSKYYSFPLIAGILLLIAGIISIVLWIPIFTIDISLLERVVDITQFHQIDPSITYETLKGFMTTCAIVGVIISIFPILGGILSIKRKLWGIALAGSIIGIFTIIPSIIGGILSFIAMILLILSRNEFKKIDQQEFEKM